MRERKQWKNGISIKDIYKFDTARVSLPVFSCDIGIPDCVVYGFHFFRLGSESDYFEASNKLNNCLRFFLDRSDMADNNPVICVSKGEKLVAAIEVHGKSIVQASGYSNRPLEYDPYLYKAYTVGAKIRLARGRNMKEARHASPIHTRNNKTFGDQHTEPFIHSNSPIGSISMSLFFPSLKNLFPTLS